MNTDLFKDYRHPTRVHIDAESAADVFPAWILTDYRWNGWACPVFDRPTAERVIAMATRGQDDQPYSFIWTTDRTGEDALIMCDGMDGEQWQEYVGSESTGYAIGSHAWTWQELDEDAPTDDEALDAWLRARAEESAAYCKTWNGALNEAYARGADRQEAYAAARLAVTTTSLGTLDNPGLRELAEMVHRHSEQVASNIVGEGQQAMLEYLLTGGWTMADITARLPK